MQTNRYVKEIHHQLPLVKFPDPLNIVSQNRHRHKMHRTSTLQYSTQILHVNMGFTHLSGLSQNKIFICYYDMPILELKLYRQLLSKP